MLKRKQPIKWDEGIPKITGVHLGVIYGQKFMVKIETVREHSNRSTWSITYEILGEFYSDAGQSGGIQRSLSCLRDGLETVCRNHHVEGVV